MGLKARIDDRLNPIYVREIRQSLRSRGFAISFLGVLLLSLLVTGLLINQSLNSLIVDEPLGPVLFQGMFACLLLSLILIVPLNAFSAMSEEWNAKAWEQLALSNLKPRQIVWGRFCAAATQGMLLGAVLIPFLLMSFLMRGTDLLDVAFAIGGTVASSIAFTFLAIAAGAFKGPRQARVLLMVILAALLCLCSGAAIGMMNDFVERRSSVSSTELTAFSWFLGSAVFLVTGYSWLSACALLTHPQENRSTALRLFTLGVMVLGALGVIWIYSTNPDSSEAYFISTAAIFALAIPSALFTTELESFSIRIRNGVSRNRVIALFSAPFLPGGGRGFLFFWLTSSAFALGMASVFHLLPERTDALPRIGYGVLLAAYTSCLVFVGLIAGVFAYFPASFGRRLGAFVVIVMAVVMGSIFSVILLNLNVGELSLWILLSPFILPAMYWSESWDDRAVYEGHLGLLCVLSALTLLINLPRMVRGVREVLAASQAVRSGSVND